MIEVTRALMDVKVDIPAASTTNRSTAISPSRLSEVERIVVSLSRWDALSSLRSRHPWRAGAARWLGAQEHNALADPRLEALRRYAVSSRLRYQESSLDVDLLISAGFSVEQTAEVDKLVAPWRAGLDRDDRWKGVIVLGVVALGVYVTALNALTISL